MGYELRHTCRVETRKFLCLVGVMFVGVLFVQYVQLPISSFQLSILSRGTATDQGNTSSISGNFTFATAALTDISLPNPLGDTYEVGERGLWNNSRPQGDLETSSSFVEDGGGGSGNVTFSRDQAEGDKLLIPDVVQISKNSSTSPEAVQGSDLPLPLDNNASNVNLSLPNNPSEDFSLAPGSNRSVSFNHEPPAARTDHPGVGSGNPEKGKDLAIRPAVLTISDMYNSLRRNRLSSHSMKPRWSMAVDKDLVYVKSQIENALPKENDQGLYAPIYRNLTMFQRSYELMEKTLKVYVYKEGERPIFHTPTLEGIYASEGWFMKLLEGNKNFVTKKPKNAHLFYLPFGSRNLEMALYVPNSHSSKNLVEHLKKYLDTIMTKYRFWNRTGGADHFLVACHDWAPSETRHLMKNCIRALCNSDVKEGFEFGKDVSLPETYVPKARNPVRDVGGKPPSRRQILAFFAGQMHGHVRPVLLRYWQDKDPDIKIFGTLPHSKGNRVYVQYMKSSKYCICPRGYEVNSPRVVEAIFYECVPVIISDGFVPPFFEILNWESFSVIVLEKDIPNLRDILLSIPRKTYLRMQMRVKKVQQHFLWHPKPVKYDLFHMTLHSIWYNRVFQFTPR
ncbi:hypothetical protein Dimus_019293 [Dionaea muscipula]